MLEKNTVHIMGLMCMLLHALDKITLMNSKWKTSCED